MLTVPIQLEDMAKLLYVRLAGHSKLEVGGHVFFCLFLLSLQTFLLPRLMPIHLPCALNTGIEFPVQSYVFRLHCLLLLLLWSKFGKLRNENSSRRTT